MTDQEILQYYGSGTTDCSRNVLVMQSENFAVIRTPGHSDWACVGGRDYIPTHTVIIHKGEWCLGGEREEWYGRVSKKILRQRLEAVQKAGKIVSKRHQDREPTRL